MRRVLLALALVSCHARERGPTRDARVLVAESKDEVVATVDGRPIYAADVAAQMRASGKDQRAALDDLVDAEVLAGAAVARGLYDDFDVTHARRAAEARRLLATDFEPRTSIGMIPDDDLRRAYDLNRNFYEHEEIAEVQHIIASVPADASPAVQQEAHDEIAALEPRAKGTTAEQFAALADPKAPVPTHVEQLGFPRYNAVEEPFAEAAFALTRPGQVSPPVHTRYGWHVLRLVQRVPARHVPIAQAEKELREGTFVPWRTHQLELYLQGLLERYAVVEHKDRVPAAE